MLPGSAQGSESYSASESGQKIALERGLRALRAAEATTLPNTPIGQPWPEGRAEIVALVGFCRL